MRFQWWSPSARRSASRRIEYSVGPWRDNDNDGSSGELEVQLGLITILCTQDQLLNTLLLLVEDVAYCNSGMRKL